MAPVDRGHAAKRRQLQIGFFLLLVRTLVKKPGKNVGLGRDYTIFATIDGYVKFEAIADERKQISVYPESVSE